MGRASDNDADDYPATWAHADLVFPVTYRFDPGAPDDGVTVHVPLAVLSRLTADGFDWQVPGFRADLVGALMQTLPKDIRRQLIPAAETTAAAYRLLEVTDEPLTVALARRGGSSRPFGASAASRLRCTRVPDHLRITFAVHDETDAVVGLGKDLDELKRQLRATLRSAVARATPVDERRGITGWDVGDLPRRVDTVRGDHTVYGYPALLDDGDSVSLRVFTTAELQERVMRGGVRRLLLLAVPVGKRAVEDASRQSRQADARPICAADRRRHRRRLHRGSCRPVGRRARRGVEPCSVRLAGRHVVVNNCRCDRHSRCARRPRSLPSPPISRSTWPS